MPSTDSKGFTLIELLIVVAIIGILSAIAIPNLLAAIQRSKQKRTMADMRVIANAWEARHVDAAKYLPAGATESVQFPAGVVVTWKELQGVLSPTYIRELPRYDAWGSEFEYRADSGIYFIRSPGRDQVYEGDTYTVTRTQYFECDIVYGNGNFLVYPEGAQFAK